MSPTNQLEARTSHIFSASADAVFDSWINPSKIGQWMFGPNVRDEVVVSIDVDARLGGAFSFLVQRQNQVIDHIGTYAIIERPHRLDFDWGVKGMSDNSRVSVTIKPHDHGCELNLIHYLDPAWSAYLQRSIDGWKHMLTVLEKNLVSK